MAFQNNENIIAKFTTISRLNKSKPAMMNDFYV